uniref:Uncharacterized protein n=1 Tax=Arundo donax TaxID=35708 RepID=A0A0A9BDR3_ARUDO
MVRPKASKRGRRQHQPDMYAEAGGQGSVELPQRLLQQYPHGHLPPSQLCCQQRSTL